MRLNLGALGMWMQYHKDRDRRRKRSSEAMEHVQTLLDHRQRGDVEGQIAEIKAIIALEPEGADLPRLILATIYDTEGEYEAAAAALQELLEERERRGNLKDRRWPLPSDAAYATFDQQFEAKVRWKRGHALANAGRTAEAVAECRRVLDLDPEGKWAEEARSLIQKNQSQDR